MEDKSIMIEFLKLYQRKYNAVSEIQRLTEEMGDLLSKNDKVSVQLVIKMRQDEMDQADKCNGAIAILEDEMNPDDRSRLQQLTENGGSNNIAETFEEKKLQEIVRNIKLVLQKTVELDKRLSSRIAGKDSFYSAGR